MSKVSVRFVLLAMLALGGCGGAGSSPGPKSTATAPAGRGTSASGSQSSSTAMASPPTSGGKATPTAAVPVLLPSQPYAPEADDPPELRARVEQEQRAGMRLMRAAAAAPQSVAGGCVHARPTTVPASTDRPLQWLPKPPRVAARILGRQVQVDVTLPSRASSAACRVEAIAFVVSSGRAGTATFNNLGGVANYWLLGRERLAGRTVRLVGQLPARGQPPYHLSVNTTDAGGRRSTYVEMPLTCPGTRCLEGFLPGQDLPTPLLATRGLTPALLERSLRQVLSGEPGWTRVTAVRCASTTACQADFTDPVVHARVRIDYAIEGEQRRGCWLGGSTRRTVTPPNARIVGTSDSRIGGCVSWLR